jgi:hypothetical protein
MKHVNMENKFITNLRKMISISYSLDKKEEGKAIRLLISFLKLENIKSVEEFENYIIKLEQNKLINVNNSQFSP